ncbi:MAG TPA: hypothetical protein VK459_19015 [Polyangiaceae bacterium]|nr:hypothetical protein [Polyangiaceae bacterium]
MLHAPMPAEMTVREARDRYLAKNGFTVEGYRAPTFQIDVLGITWTLPNPEARRQVVPLHDIHHVVTGYGTDLAGEAEQSAWELRGGIHSWFLWLFKLSAIFLGLFLAPRRVVRALRRARGQRTLYLDPPPYEVILEMRVGELRAKLGIPPEGQADAPARLHRRAPLP